MHETNEGRSASSANGTPLPVRLDLNLLTVFEALWQERHVARAAERMALSQPATSHALARLRALVGDQLFERGLGGMRPTARAEAMWPDVSRALAHARSALGRGFDPTKLGRRLRLGMTNNVALTLLQGLIHQLRKQAPDLNLTVLQIDRRRAPELLLHGQVDAVIGLWDGELTPGLERRHLYQESLGLVAREGHPILAGSLKLKQFAAWPQVLVSPSGEPVGPVDRLLAKHGLQRRIVLVVADYGLAAEAIASSDLVGVLAEGPTERLAPKLGIASRPLPLALDPLSIDIIAPKSVGQMLDWLQEVLLIVTKDDKSPS